MKGIFLLLGSNLNDRLSYINNAIEQFGNQIIVTSTSSIFETEPWGRSNQPWFLNMVVQIETSLSPEDLLHRCLEIEKLLGRKRAIRWAERTIDIDILYFHDLILKTSILQIPHPGIPKRRFTLLPMTELAANEVHPDLNLSQSEMLATCEDPLEVKKTNLKLSS